MKKRWTDGFARIGIIMGLLLLMLTSCAKIYRKPSAPLQGGWERVPEILRQIVVPRFPDRDYIITDFGAKGDGKTDCLPAFVQAIKKCNDEGGGRVVVPRGLYLVNGPIHLKSNVNLHVSEGATIRFSANPDHYLPVVLTKWEGTELFNYSPLIYAYQVTNIAITGKGTIDGNAKHGFATWKSHQKVDQRLLRRMGNDGVPVSERVFGKGHWLRPSMIQPFGCKNVLIEDVTIVDSPFWVIHPTFCMNVTVRGVTVRSWNKNNDGCDPDASVNVLIENCTFLTGDDGIAIKSGRDQDGWRVGQATENVVIRNCRIGSIANGLCIGSEMSGSVRNVYMQDCSVDSALSTIYFKSNLDRGGRIENIRVRNVTVKRAKGAVIRFETNYKGHRGNYFPPLFRNFVIEDVVCKKADNYAIFAEGVEDSKLQNILLKNITVEEAKESLYLRFANNFRMVNVRINNQLMPEFPDMTPADKAKLRMGW